MQSKVERQSGAQEDHALLWLYGVMPNERAILPQVADVEGRLNYRLVCTARLAALVARVPADEYDESHLQPHMDDQAWLVPRVLAFSATVADVFAHTVILPARFGTVFSSQQHLAEVLVADETSLVDRLQHLQGREEWGLKIFAHVDRYLADEVSRTLAELGNAAGSGGRLHFMKKKLATTLQTRVRDAIQARALSIHESLLKEGYPADVGQNPAPEHLDNGAVLLLKTAYLVTSDARRHFLAVVSELADASAPTFDLVPTGPWVPYSFAALAPSD